MIGIAQVETALLALIASDTAVKAWTPGGPLIQSAGSGSYTDETGQLSKYPAVLMLLESFSLRPGDKLTYRTYEQRLTFRLLCWQKLPSAPNEETAGGLVDVGVHEMMDDLERILGGARLTIGADKTDPIVLRGGATDYLGPEGTILGLRIEIPYGYQSTGVA